MPIIKTDYRKTSMYKFICNDTNVKEIYVGHTTNFISRKSNHKASCNKPNHKSYNLKLYTTIRKNGGWENWSMVEIEKYPCEDANEARARERYWYEYLNAKLNMIYPKRTRKEYELHNADKIKEQTREYNKEYSKINAERIREREREYKKQNADKIRERCREYYKQNANKIAESKREYNKRNADKLKEYHREYQKQNIDKINKYEKKYRNLNADKIKERAREYQKRNVERLNEYRKEYNRLKREKSLIDRTNDLLLPEYFI